jgi:hypothetical protein
MSADSTCVKQGWKFEEYSLGHLLHFEKAVQILTVSHCVDLSCSLSVVILKRNVSLGDHILWS